MNYLQLLAAVGDLVLIVLLPIVVIMARILWVIKVNDLPHIHEEIIKLGGGGKH
jgi:hypothetical protein